MFHRDRKARLPNRQTKIGLMVGHCRDIGLTFFGEKAIFDAGVGEFMCDRAGQMFQVLLSQS